MQIICNNQPRHILYGHELTEKERADFDYYSPEELDEASFFRYRGETYDLSEFMRISPSIAPHPQREGWEKFDGYVSDTFFSGVLVKYCDGGESVIVARYFC